MNTTTQRIKEQSERYDVEYENLKELYREHQKTPHEVIGFEEYRELDDEQIYQDGERYFVCYLDVNEWEHEIEHVIDEMDFEAEDEYQYIKALQQVYLRKARKVVGEDLNDVDTRWVIFDKTRLEELFPRDAVDFKWESGGGCFKVEELHDEEVWLDGDLEDGVIWKPHEGEIAEETKDQELRNFVEIQKIHRGDE